MYGRSLHGNREISGLAIGPVGIGWSAAAGWPNTDRRRQAIQRWPRFTAYAVSALHDELSPRRGTPRRARALKQNRPILYRWFADSPLEGDGFELVVRAQCIRLARLLCCWVAGSASPRQP